MSYRKDPVDRLIELKAEIDLRLERLKDLSDQHFGADPDDMGWNEVGDVREIADRLEQITDFAFNEGEHAAPPPAKPSHRRENGFWGA